MSEEIKKDFFGKVELLDFMGNDRVIAGAAWVCTDRGKDSTQEDIERVIKFLAKEKHGTPFEHVVFRFMVTCPIFTARQWIRHRVGTFNERSMRYVKSKNDCYVPYDFSDEQKKIFEESIAKAFDAYEEIISLADDKRRAREAARAVLPLGMFTKFEWTVNYRSLANFIRQRTDEHAQYEIRFLAQLIMHVVLSLDELSISSMALREQGWDI